MVKCIARKVWENNIIYFGGIRFKWTSHSHRMTWALAEGLTHHGLKHIFQLLTTLEIKWFLAPTLGKPFLKFMENAIFTLMLFIVA